MLVRECLLELQWRQLKHDESYHKDVVFLPLALHLKHLTLHNAKYTAYLFEAAESCDSVLKIRTLVDAFAIVLAIGNTLNQNLGQDLDETDAQGLSFVEFGHQLALRLKGNQSDPYWAGRKFALYTGRLAKACESLDHLEGLPFRETIKSSNVELLKVVIAEASVSSVDLVVAYEARMREVEGRSIFDDHFRRR